MNVSIPQSDNAKVRAIKERYSLDLLSATVLERRGARSGEDLLYYLENDVIYHHSPFEAEDVPVAVDRIIDAIDEDERILVFGDRDVDGVTAAAIMVRSLRKLGAKDVSYRLPMGDEPYGLTADSVSEILEKGYTLVITVDCGISSINEIATLERSGVDVIVLDHHIAGDELPPAAAITASVVPSPPSAISTQAHLQAGKTSYAAWASNSAVLRDVRVPLNESDANRNFMPILPPILCKSHYFLSYHLTKEMPIDPRG